MLLLKNIKKLYIGSPVVTYYLTLNDREKKKLRITEFSKSYIS